MCSGYREEGLLRSLARSESEKRHYRRLIRLNRINRRRKEHENENEKHGSGHSGNGGLRHRGGDGSGCPFAQVCRAAEGYETVSCRLLELRGDTVITINKMVKAGEE